MRKQLLAISIILCTVASCNSVEKDANAKLEEAREAYLNGDCSLAKQLIDSIKILYPKAYDTRHASMRLLEDVELKEQEMKIATIDSTLAAKQEEFEVKKKGFILEKDTAYQQIGHYIAPSQVIDRNLHRSYLRFQTDETGNASMTSIYCGSGIRHTSVKVLAPDGSSAETPSAKDSYETENLGERTEKADFKLGEDGGVINFIRENKDKNIKVTFIGDRNFSTTMTPADRQAAAAVKDFSDLLSSVDSLNKEKEQANLKIRFINKKVARREASTEEAD